MICNQLKILAVGLMMLLAAPVHGGGFPDLLCGANPCLTNCVGKYCCDDYCGKLPPAISPKTCFQCDDYCRKSAPCSEPVKCFGRDDYCRKAFQLCCPSKCDFQCHPKRHNVKASPPAAD